MITTSTWGRRDLFRNERWANLLMDTIYHYRGSAYLLHEFVIMPDHLHALITPLTSLEKAAQFIKGGFSYRAKKELGSNMEIWQKGFSDHRVRDGTIIVCTRVMFGRIRCGRDCVRGRKNIRIVPRAVGLNSTMYQGLKPTSSKELDGAAEAAPFQSKTVDCPLIGKPVVKDQ
jgi:putative transposase